MEKLIKALTLIHIEIKHVRKRENALRGHFLKVAEGCEFNQPEGADGPECSHKKQKHIWCDAFGCPLIK